MTLRERLRSLVESLPTNGSVVLTRDDLEELLGAESDSSSNADASAADLTVAQIAERFNRKPQTVRDWITSGKLRGYRFNGREYRVTAAALAEFEEERRNGEPARRSSANTPDLSTWRRVG